MPADTAENTDVLATLEDLEGAVGGVSSGPGGTFLPEDYGGDPTGATDSTAALQAAIVAADAVNGTVHLGPGTNTWKFSSTITGASAIRITGAGGGMGGSLKGPQLLYTGSGDSPAISMLNKIQWELDHIRLNYSEEDFTGPYVSVHGTSTDILNWHIHHVRCGSPALSAAEIAGNCMGFVCLNNGIVGKISESGFDNAQNLIVLGTVDPTPTDRGYCNNIQITNCGFNHSWADGAILISSGDAESVSIDHCYFEAGGASAHSAIRGTNTTQGDPYDCLVYTFQVSNCWFGDNAANLDWISGINSLGNSSPVLVTENFFDSPGSTGRVVTAGENGALIVFTNNRVSDGFAAIGRIPEDPAAPLKILSYGNSLGGGCPLYDSTEDPPDEITRLGPLTNVLNGQVSIEANSAFDDQDFSLLSGGITLGGNIPSAGAYPDAQSQSLIYTKDVSAAGRQLTLQSKTNDVDNGVQIVAGSGTPTVKFRANGTGVAFHDQTPAARPDYTITNHTLDRALNESGDTTAQVANVLGTLINDLIAIGLLQ